MKYVSLCIAILGFLMSLAQWIYTLYKNRTRFSMSIERMQWYERPEYKYNRCICTFMIWNLSSAPLTITRMSIDETNCLITHQWIGECYYPAFPESDIPKTERKFSPDFPLMLPPNGGGIYSVIFDFDLKMERPNNLIKVDVQTTHKKKSFCLFCPEAKNNELYL